MIVGNPTALKVGRRVLLVSYVSMGEWQTFDAMLKVDEGKAVQELMYRSLHRADPLISRRAARRWTRRAAADLMHLICALSIPPAVQGLAVSDKESARSMKTTYRMLSRIHGWTPAEISDMSPAQIYSYQMGGPDGTGIQKMTGAEYQSFRARRGMAVGGLN